MERPTWEHSTEEPMEIKEPIETIEDIEDQAEKPVFNRKRFTFNILISLFVWMLLYFSRWPIFYWFWVRFDINLSNTFFLAFSVFLAAMTYLALIHWNPAKQKVGDIAPPEKPHTQTQKTSIEKIITLPFWDAVKLVYRWIWIFSFAWFLVALTLMPLYFLVHVIGSNS